MFVLAMRALLVYPLLVLLLRFLGRGLQFHARPYDIAVQVLIGSAAAHMVIDRSIPLGMAVIAIGVLAIMHTIISLVSLWHPAKRYLVGEPTMIVENGRILKAELIRH